MSVLFLWLLFGLSSAQPLFDGVRRNSSETPAPEPGVTLTPWRHGSIRESLGANAERPVQEMQGFFSALEGAVMGDRNGSAGNVVCNVNEKWARLATKYLERRGLKGVSERCVTMRRLSNGIRPRIPDLQSAQDAFGEAGDRFRANAALNWTEARGVGRFEFDTKKQRCELRRQFAIRAKNRWFLLIEFTDAPLRGQGAHGTRYLAAEHVRMEPRSFASLRLFPDEAAGTATTLSQANARPPAGGRLGMPELEGNEALSEVLGRASRDAEHADENVIRSNIAILVLPLLMNVVPVALFTDVNAFGMLVYSVLTDVLTAVPLAIKGGELVWIARRRYHAAAAYYAGEADDSIAVAELFLASCRSAQDVDGTGVAFLVVAFAFMIFGVSMEFVALRCMRKKRLGASIYMDGSALGVAALLGGGRRSSTQDVPRTVQPHEYHCVCVCHPRTHSTLHQRTSAVPAGVIPADHSYSRDFDSAPQLPPIDGHWG